MPVIVLVICVVSTSIRVRYVTGACGKKRQSREEEEDGVGGGGLLERAIASSQKAKPYFLVGRWEFPNQSKYNSACLWLGTQCVCGV